jgi:hypothetical protein
MEHEGMVHALEEIHRLLRRAGTLIEIHPALEVPFVEVRSNREPSFREDDPGYDYEDDLRSAEEAVEAVVWTWRLRPRWAASVRAADARPSVREFGIIVPS